MAATEKVVTLFGLRGLAEGSYAGSTFPLTSPDPILMTEPVEAEISYAHGGERGQQPGAGGQLQRTAKSGRAVAFPYSVEGRGSGAAYSSSTPVTPQDVHLGFLISGHAATHVDTPGSETVTYAPESSGFDSGAFEGFAREEEIRVEGAYATMSFEAEAGGHGIFTFEVQGLLDALPSDAVLPSLSYQNPSTQPPKIENIALDINGVTGWVVRSISFEQNRALHARADANATATSVAHAGFTPGRVEPSLTIVVEARALATFNAYSLAEASTKMSALTLQIGATQYNKYKLTAAQAQLVNVTPDSDGDTALWELEFMLAASTPVANDWYSWLFD